MKLRIAFGDTLRELRQDQHRTLREVSVKSGVALGYVSEVERGHKEASSEVLESLTNTLGITMADFLILTALRLGNVPDTAETLLDEYTDLVVR
jgi:transcriptional regulator with XRE-family HTH domain